MARDRDVSRPLLPDLIFGPASKARAKLRALVPATDDDTPQDETAGAGPCTRRSSRERIAIIALGLDLPDHALVDPDESVAVVVAREDVELAIAVEVSRGEVA